MICSSVTELRILCRISPQRRRLRFHFQGLHYSATYRLVSSGQKIKLIEKAFQDDDSQGSDATRKYLPRLYELSGLLKSTRNTSTSEAHSDFNTERYIKDSFGPSFGSLPGATPTQRYNIYVASTIRSCDTTANCSKLAAAAPQGVQTSFENGNPVPDSVLIRDSITSP
ncbi:uncharacterized protein CLUP02_04890 [Colletotrichum lupini]|uniref:Uncharacterized protein n=1 Tax=Colletotrichum lupini TaxID=145971 RepID=A0A9Q8SLL0_9PEZI|nr:uncharacterized protein CLUP02_04890 [Colletotrichum lupini]UQC79410.1 hypothetical protein CLUP02_04890 [Colletotrichum lupini]